MAISIQGSNMGYDANEMQVVLNDLNTQCIIDTITVLNDAMASLEQAVDNVWAGQSAMNFKKNLASDKETISKKLTDSYSTIESSFGAIISKWSDVDESIIPLREVN